MMKWTTYILLFYASVISAQDTTLITYTTGTFGVPASTFYDFANDVLHIKGAGPGSTVIQNTLGAMFQARSPYVEVSLSSPVLRGDRELCLSDVSSIEAGHLIWIRSDSAAETGWGYVESDLVMVEYVDTLTGCVAIHEALNFNYTPSVETVQVRAYQPKKLLIEDLTMRCSSGYALGQSFVTATGMIVELRNVEIVNNSAETPDGISLSQCYNINTYDLSIDGFRYGILINQSRNVSAHRTYATNCRHAFTPSSWTECVEIDGLNGYKNRATMDAHACFNVTYRNVTAFDTELSNCRSFGVVLDNCKFYNIQSYGQGYVYIGMTTAAQISNEYDYLLGEYPITIRGVEWIKKDQRGTHNGLAIYWAGLVDIANSVAHSISIHGGGVSGTRSKVNISNCYVGHLYIYGLNLMLEVDHTTFDKALYPEMAEALDLRGTGKRQIAHSSFLGWSNSDCLIEYLNQPYLEFPKFYQCSIPYIGDLVRTFQYSLNYTMGFVDSHLRVGQALNSNLVVGSYFTDSDTAFSVGLPPD